MERKSLLGLAAEIDDALGIELEAEDELVVGSELGLGKGLEESVEQEQVLVLRIVRHDNQEADYSVEDLEDLLVGL
jgi:hypothetical protein